MKTLDRWADTHGRTLRVEATERHAGQYVRLFGWQALGHRCTRLDGWLVVLIRHPSTSLASQHVG